MADITGSPPLLISGWSPEALQNETPPNLLWDNDWFLPGWVGAFTDVAPHIGKVPVFPHFLAIDKLGTVVQTL